MPFIKNPHTLEGGLELKEKNQASNETVTCALIETENAAKLDKEKNSDDNDELIISPAFNETDPLGIPIAGVIDEEKMEETFKNV